MASISVFPDRSIVTDSWLIFSNTVKFEDEKLTVAAKGKEVQFVSFIDE